MEPGAEEATGGAEAMPMQLLEGSERSARRGGHRCRCTGAFTLVELLTVAAVITFLLALLFPAGQALKRYALGTKCLANTRSFGTAILLYVADHGSLPNKADASDGAQGFTSLLFPAYLKTKTVTGRYALQCPLAGEQERRAPYGFEYAGNGSLMKYFHTLRNIPAPASRVVLASEDYYNHFYDGVHLNITIWGTGETNASKAGAREANEGSVRKPQYHLKGGRRGLHMFFLDGSASLVLPENDNWMESPTYGDATNGGYFYDRRQFNKMKLGTLVVE